MKIIVGLGNPGDLYVRSRHNAGIMLVDQIFNLQYSIFNETYGWRRKKNILVAEFPDLILVKTGEYFMNESGSIVRDFFKTSPYSLDNFYLSHDDLDIRLGEYKIQFGTGPKVHNGVEAVEKTLGTKEFNRIRIGIDNRSDANRIPGEEYVLQKFMMEEREILDGVLKKIGNEIT